MLSMDIQTGKHKYLLYKTRGVSDKLMHTRVTIIRELSQ